MKLVFFTVFVLSSHIILGQINDYNLIITVNDKLIISDIKVSKIMLENNDKSIDTIDCQYKPGNLIVLDTDLELTSYRKITLSVDYIKREKRTDKYYHYDIDLYGVNFSQSYLILRLYNLDNRKYRQIFEPLEGREYTFEIDMPSNSVTRIRRK